MSLEHSHSASPFLTRAELATRWHLKDPNTLSRKYRKLGLRPFVVGKMLLFPLVQIEAVEQRAATNSPLST
jgi:hypothetical protein